MADIELRLGRDVVVLAPPVESLVTAMGVATADFALAMLVEPETIEEAYRRALMAGAACLVAPTGWMTRARLAQMRLEDRAKALVRAAFSPLTELRPQHVLAEIGPCGLPFDGSSAASLREHRRQYEALVRLLTAETFDGFLLSGFRRFGTLRPALEAVTEQSTRPVFIQVDVHTDGRLADGFETVADLEGLAREYGAKVVGVRVVPEATTDGGARELDEAAVRIAGEFGETAERPLLVSLLTARQTGEENEAGARQKLDELVVTAERLRDVGVQFLRAEGPDAGVLETAALAGAVGGMPVVSFEDVAADLGEPEPEPVADDGEIPFMPIPEDLIARFSARVDAALRRDS